MWWEVRVRKTLVFVAVLVLAYGTYKGPSAWRDGRAVSFVKFAEGGVTLSPVENGRMLGTGDPIGVPGGVSLMMGAEFEFTNSAGEKRRASFCNGHPDYWEITTALPLRSGITVAERDGRRLKFELAKGELEDPHTANSWWIHHMGFERDVRVVVMKE